VTCKCICKCKGEAGALDDYPELCGACGLCAKLDMSAIPKHGMPEIPTVWPKLEPLVPVSNEQKDKALQDFVAENGL
jgi:hypothetical protein